MSTKEELSLINSTKCIKDKFHFIRKLQLQINSQITYKITAFSKVTSDSSDVINTPSGSAPAAQLVYKSIIEVFRGLNKAEASM
jgi:hypothetical protein